MVTGTANPDLAGIVELLAAHEEALAELYRAYAWRFSSRRRLWNDLSADERIHAGWIRGLAEADRGRVLSGAARGLDVWVRAIRDSLARARGELARVHSGETDVAGALSAALGSEKAVLAAPFLDAARTRDPVSRALLRGLRSSTVEHLERIRAAYEEEARLAS